MTTTFPDEAYAVTCRPTWKAYLLLNWQ